MSGKPLLVFSGESQNWTEWAEHFESVATVNKWDSDDDSGGWGAQWKWLKVRLTGKARTAFQKLPADKYGECVKALKQRFELDSKKQLYVAELHTRERHRDEDWASYGDALRVLADKAYSDLHGGCIWGTAKAPRDGGGSGEKRSKYVLVAADCFTKWVEAYGIPNQEAVTVAVKLVDEMFCRFSPPEQGTALMFGRQATIPVDLMYNLNQGQEKELPDCVRQLREGLKEAYALTSALNDGTSSSPKSNNSSGLSQQPQVMARPDTPHGGEDMLLSDDEDGGQDHDAHPPDVGPAAEVPVPPEQHPIPPGIPDALRRYPTRERRPPDRYIEH
eukprot:Em0022g950a